MNSPECLDLLQRRLDGLTPAGRAALERHLAGCPHCRDLHQAAQLLEDGLRAVPPPAPPPGLAGRIVLRVTAERRARLGRRRRVLVLAAAACLLLTPLAVSLLGGLAGRDANPAPPVQVVKKTPHHAPPPRPAPAPPAAPAPSLEDTVGEAGSAVAALTDRLAGKTREQARMLWGAAPLEVTPRLPGLQEPLDPAARSLREAGQGVSAGLETVAGPARRALTYFTRELTPLD